ncbi:hypothetical protein J4G37_63340, partial [Microvirga sp. 3-52]|nr:hypothetical protein [Microvirga sp. 3-52]
CGSCSSRRYGTPPPPASAFSGLGLGLALARGLAQALAPGVAQVRRAEEEEDERPDPVRVQPRALPTAEEAGWLCRRRRRKSERPCSGARGEML